MKVYVPVADVQIVVREGARWVRFEVDGETWGGIDLSTRGAGRSRWVDRPVPEWVIRAALWLSDAWLCPVGLAKRLQWALTRAFDSLFLPEGMDMTPVRWRHVLAGDAWVNEHLERVSLHRRAQLDAEATASASRSG